MFERPSFFLGVVTGVFLAGTAMAVGVVGATLWSCGLFALLVFISLTFKQVMTTLGCRTGKRDTMDPLSPEYAETLRQPSFD